MSNQHQPRPRDSPSQTSSPRDGEYRPSPGSRRHSSSSRSGPGEGPSARPSRQQLRNLQTVAEMTKDPNQTQRAPTGVAPLGVADRTIVEGLGHLSQGGNSRLGGNSRPGGSIRQESWRSERNDNASGNSRPGASRQSFVSRTPSHAKSLFINQSEANIASRQTQYESLPPDQQAKQESCAQSFLKREGRCSQDYGWQRVEGIGYQCEGLNHLVTDELIAEGKGGFMVLRETNPYFPAMGPYYEMAGRPWWFKYAGPEPKWPDVVDEASLEPHRKGENEARERLAQIQNPFYGQQLAVRKLAIQKADAEFLKNMTTSEQQAYFVDCATRRTMAAQLDQPGRPRPRPRRRGLFFV